MKEEAWEVAKRCHLSGHHSHLPIGFWLRGHTRSPLGGWEALSC